jgi:hypothetical protein
MLRLKKSTVKKAFSWIRVVLLENELANINTKTKVSFYGTILEAYEPSFPQNTPGIALASS